MMGAGEIDLRDATLEQVLDLYAMLVNRTVLHATLPRRRLN